MNPLFFAVVIALLVILFCMFNKSEHFSTKDQASDIYKKTKSLFKNGGTYLEYLDKVSNGDILDYDKLKQLNMDGKFTVENIKNVLS